MRVIVFNTKRYDRQYFDAANTTRGHELDFLEPRLTSQTASLAAGYDVVCVFVNDIVDAVVLEILSASGVKGVALRCAGFNNVDVVAAERLGIEVVRVPAYSPYAVAEHAVGLMLALNRKLHRAYGRIRDGNFSLEGLIGFDMAGRTVGVIGTGHIGEILTRILLGFGCTVLAYDIQKNRACLDRGVRYVTLPELYSACDILSIHCPLVPATHHLIDTAAITQMKRGVMLINTSRGAIVDTGAVIASLKSGQIGALGIDVYEEEADLFFEDLSENVIQDDIFARLLTFPNVLVTGHQAFLTDEALTAIAEVTLDNIAQIERDETCANVVHSGHFVGKA